MEVAGAIPLHQLIALGNIYRTVLLTGTRPISNWIVRLKVNEMVDREIELS